MRLVSPLSVWEVAMLTARGRLALSLDVRAWVDRALGGSGAAVAGFTPAIALESALLPGTPSADPVDRLLIATAGGLGAMLVTRDREILAYGGAGHVTVLDAAA